MLHISPLTVVPIPIKPIRVAGGYVCPISGRTYSDIQYGNAQWAQVHCSDWIENILSKQPPNLTLPQRQQLFLEQK